MYAFETYDKPRMRPLPGGCYALCDYRYYARVPDNYHLEYDGHYYSVLYTYHGKPAILKATMSEIRICDENNRLICRHPRSYKDFPRYITDVAHMPEHRQYYKELNSHDGNYYRRWASIFGEAMVTLIDLCFAAQNTRNRPTTVVKAYCTCAMRFHAIWFRKQLRCVLMQMPASILTSKKRSIRLQISTLHLLTEPVTSQSMKTSEGGTAINERNIV